MSGHKVRVLEKGPGLEKPPGGVRIPPNVTKILVQWGLEGELRKRGSVVREGTDICDCKLFSPHFGWPSCSICHFANFSLVETGRLLGHLEWAHPVIQESGAKFYMMRVCPSHQVGKLIIHTITVQRPPRNSV